MILRPFVIALALSQTCCVSSGSAPAIVARHPLVDLPAPSFTARDVVTGAVISERPKQPGIRIYFFVATWCGPCGGEWENLDVLRTQYASQGVTVVGIAEASERADVKRECKRFETAMPIVNDANMSIAGRWNVSVLPSLFVVDRANVVRFVQTGYRDGDLVEVERQVDRLLGTTDRSAASALTLVW